MAKRRLFGSVNSQVVERARLKRDQERLRMVSKTLNFYGQAAVVASILELILKQHELAFGWLNFVGAGLGLLLHVVAYILMPAAAEDEDV